MILSHKMTTEIESSLGLARAAKLDGQVEQAWAHMVRAHIISQPDLRRHLRVHRAMLGLAISAQDVREAAGQMLRLALAPIGHLAGQIPWGNIGRSTVGIMTPAQLPTDIAAMYVEAGIRIR